MLRSNACLTFVNGIYYDKFVDAKKNIYLCIMFYE